MTTPPALFKQILTELAFCSPEQVRQIRDRLGLLYPVQDEAPLDSFVLEGLRQELIRRGLLSARSKFQLQQLKGRAPDLMKNVAVVEEFLLKNFKRNANPAEKALLGQIAAGALLELLVSWNRSLNYTTILRNVPNIPTALDAAFPGYISAGMLSMVIRGKE